jgi:ribose-phosphate pyrophosphokinase
MMILAFPDYLTQAQQLAEKLNVECTEIYLHHFPDGESLVRLPVTLSEHVLIYRSLDHPNDKLIELLLCARTARCHGVKRLTLVAPYLCYMRQDTANQPGEAVSQQIIGEMLADLFDDVITVDPHLHRINYLQQAIPIDNAITLHATDVIANFLRQKYEKALLLGPDQESEQWVTRIAKQTGFEYVVASKIRRGDNQVEIILPDREYQHQPVILVDDMASTGRTLTNTATLLRKKGANNIVAVITHALFCGDAEQQILQSGINTIWSTDSIAHPTSVICLTELLAESVRKLQ